MEKQQPEELALLGFVYRQTHGCMAAPSAGGAFKSAYVALSKGGLIEYCHERHMWVISEAGDLLLRSLSHL